MLAASLTSGFRSKYPAGNTGTRQVEIVPALTLWLAGFFARVTGKLCKAHRSPHSCSRLGSVHCPSGQLKEEISRLDM